MRLSPEKMSAYDRICAFLDLGSVEIIYNESIVAAKGKVNGTSVYAYAQDFTINAGAMTEDMADKICAVMDMALGDMVPLVSINECAGAHIQEGVRSLAGFGRIFQKNIQASGVIPQISVVLGACAGGAVYSPALADFTIMTKDSSYMFITGPGVVKVVTGEEVTKEELGGASVHALRSGVAHFVAEDEDDAFQIIRMLIDYLPMNNMVPVARRCVSDSRDHHDESLNHIVPENPKKPYDIYKVIESIVDDNTFFEVHKKWAKNIVVGFARLDGFAVGVVANQPKILAGVLDSDASRKAARFVRFCDAFNIPILSLVDVPGFLCGTAQEHTGVITHGAKLLYAYGEATVPKLTVTLRKSFGGAHVTMGSKELGADACFAWPSAQVAVMGAESAAAVLSSKSADDISNPENAVNNGSIDEIIEPATTRARLVEALAGLTAKQPVGPYKKHGCMPL